MVQSELDSFYVKFKNLLRAEKDATLTLKSEAGRAVISLSVDLGHVLSEHGLRNSQPRNGPARQRRREKRAEVRKVAAEKAVSSAEEAKEKEESNQTIDKVVKSSSIEPTAVDKVVVKQTEKTEVKAEEAKNLEGKEGEETAGKASTPVNDIQDEFCSDLSYAKENQANPMVPPLSTNAGRTPTSSRGLGGFDYYTLTYDDPTSSDSE